MQRKAIIYKPAKTAMQSGLKNTQQWVLELLPVDEKSIDPVMGWVSSSDTTRQLRLCFDTQAEAVEYAKEHHYAYDIRQPHARSLKTKSYAANFSFEKRQYSDVAAELQAQKPA